MAGPAEEAGTRPQDASLDAATPSQDAAPPDQETVKPGPPSEHSADDWESPAIMAPEEPNSAKPAPSFFQIDDETSALVELALTPVEPRRAPEPTPEIVIGDMELGEAELIGQDGEPSAEEAELELPRSVPRIPDSEFSNAPRAPGAVSVIPEKATSSTSFKTIQTLLQLEGLTGVSFQKLENLPEGETEHFRQVMLEGRWPDSEHDARRVIIETLKILEPKYGKQTRWMQQSLTQLRQVFFQELKRKGGQLEKLADRLRRQPPPMPKTGNLKPGKGA